MFNYLALGDSYTFGEQVPFLENFPNQTTIQLEKLNVPIGQPIILATTGWTTDELLKSIQESSLSGTYSLVTLLIGVNNQYRGYELAKYIEEFTQLLKIAISFANHIPNNVVVISIPDWGVTPFAEGRDRQKITAEIDIYNQLAKDISIDNKCHFLDITDSTRSNGTNNLYLAEDLLHPSSKEYEIWSNRLVNLILKESILV